MGGFLTATVSGAPLSNPRAKQNHQRQIQLQRKRQLAEYEYQRRAFPLEFIPSGARQRALAQTQLYDNALISKSPRSIAGWVSIGPSPIIVPFDRPVCGRVSAVAIDPINPLHWLLGAAQGGIWETYDSGNSWSPRTDDQPSLATGAIAFSQSNPSIIYVGTGEPNFSTDSYAGAGLLVSYNRGTNWQTCSTNFAETSISAIRVDPSNPTNLSVSTIQGAAGKLGLLADFPPNAPAPGVFVSTNGGGAWTRVLTGEATDVAMDPYHFDRQYAALGYIYGAPTNGIYRTTNHWQTVQFINGPWTSLAAPTNIGRIAMAVATPNSQIVYIGISADINSGGLVGIFRSDNAWSPSPTWTNLPPPEVGGNSWYAFALAVDPSDSDTLYMAELSVQRYQSGFWAELGKFIHADNHVLTFFPWSGFGYPQLLVGNDGGLWGSTQPISTSWFDLNNQKLAISQMYKGSVHPQSNHALALAGTQDNGTAANLGNLTWQQIQGADGSDNAISATHPDSWWATSWETLDGLHIFRTTNSGTNFESVTDGLDILNAPFFIHFEKSPANDDIFIAGMYQLYRITNYFSGLPPQWYTNSPIMLNSLGKEVAVSAMAFAPSDTNSLTYAFGTEDGQLRVTSNGGSSWSSPNPAGAVPGRGITGLAFSPANPNTLFVSLSGFDEGTPGHPGHVFMTTNAFAGSPSWANISPPVDLPMNCILVQSSNGASIFVGADIGVWTTSNGGGSWTHYGPALGMPNVAVYDLRMNSVGQVTAFTHGRGAFNFVSNFIPIPVVDGPVHPIDIACLECPGINWLNPGDLVTLEVTVQNILPIDTVNLVASILPSAQIMPVNGTQNYGVVAGQGAAITRSFTVRAATVGGSLSPSEKAPPSCGDTIQVTIQFQDQSANLGQVSIPFRLGTPFHPISEDFETTPVPGLPPGWASTASGLAVPWMTTSNMPPNDPASDSPDPAHVPDPPASNAISNVSVYTPALAGVGQSLLYSSPFTITSSIAQVYFRQAFGVSNAYDGCILELSIAGGAFQELIRSGGSFAQYGYNLILKDNNPLGPQPAWSGDSGGWLPCLANLPASAAGHAVQLRWHFATSRGLTNGGWFVDSVAVTDPQCLPPVSNPLILNPHLSGSQFSFSVPTITNRTFEIDYKTNITDPSWQFLQNLSGNGATQTVSVSLIPTNRFFRFVVH